MTNINTFESNTVETQRFKRPDMPGHFTGDVTVEAHSTHAWNLIYGYRMDDGRINSSISLVRFAGDIKSIWNAAEYNDPIADWYLEQIHQTILSATREIAAIGKSVSNVISSDFLKIKVAQSDAAAAIDFGFANPYGYIAARMVMACDYAIRSVYTCLHVGLITAIEGNEYNSQIMKTARHALSAHQLYKFKGVTREDAKQRNARWLAAVEIMGEPPVDIINGRRPEIAPRIIKREEVSKHSEPEASSDDAEEPKDEDALLPPADEPSKEDDPEPAKKTTKKPSSKTKSSV